MNLTNKLRSEFVNDVMKSIPLIHYYNMADAMQEIRIETENRLPSDILTFSKNHPNLLERNLQITVRELSYEFVNHRGNSDTRNPYFKTVDHPVNKLPIDYSKWVDKKKRYDDEQNSRLVLADRLNQIASSCSTLAKLKAAFPELESYMPVEVVKKNLPVASGSIVTDLLNVGLKIPKVSEC